MVRIGGPLLVGVLAVMALVRVSGAQADAVQGTATVGANKIVLANGMAVSYAAANGAMVSVLLSDRPADRQEFATDTKTGAGEPLLAGLFEGAWKSQHFGKRFSGFTFTVADKTRLISDEFLVGGRNNTFSLSSSEYVIELKSTTPRLVGRIRTGTPIVDTGSTKAGLDATFDIAVAAIK